MLELSKHQTTRQTAFTATAAAVVNVAICHWQPDVIRHTPRPTSEGSSRVAIRVAEVGGPMVSKPALL